MAARVHPGTRRVYSSYWNRIEKHWGEPASAIAATAHGLYEVAVAARVPPAIA